MDQFLSTDKKYFGNKLINLSSTNSKKVHIYIHYRQIYQVFLLVWNNYFFMTFFDLMSFDVLNILKISKWVQNFKEIIAKTYFKNKKGKKR